MPNAPRRLPIVPSTVEVNGYVHSASDLIWAGFRWHEAKLRVVHHTGNDRPTEYNDHLIVPWCHADDDQRGEDNARFDVRPRDPAYRFTRARNGAWVLERGDG